MAERYFSSNEARGWIYNGSPIVNWEASIPSYIKAWKAKDNKQMTEQQKLITAFHEREDRERAKFGLPPLQRMNK